MSDTDEGLGGCAIFLVFILAWVIFLGPCVFQSRVDIDQKRIDSPVGVDQGALHGRVAANWTGRLSGTGGITVTNPVNVGLAVGVCWDCLAGDHWECDDRSRDDEANGEEVDCPCFAANHGEKP